MKLNSSMGISIMDAVNTAIGAGATIDFYINATNVPTTGLLGATSRVKLATTPIQTRTANATTAYGTFAAMTTGVVATTGTAAYWSLFNSTGSSLFTGTIGSGSGDISFNTVNWDAGDNVNISSLTFTQNL